LVFISFLAQLGRVGEGAAHVPHKNNLTRFFVWAQQENSARHFEE